ncbi:TPA: hypothetical protein EYG96_02820 [Candidatus Gracilibacteria bacterium]|nr:hypothetical protein [Candidatus Gracilibacteria bacterium]
MKKFFSVLLAFFFIHVAAMPTMVSLADEGNMNCHGQNMQMTEEKKEKILEIQNEHNCCTHIMITPSYYMFSSEKKSVIPHITFSFIIEKNKVIKKINLNEYLTQKNIPDIFLQHKKYIVMRV